MEPIIRIEQVRKTFSYTNPDPNSNDGDMWVDYILGLLGRSHGRFAAHRKFTVALDSISLTVHAGEFFGLLGPNGAGKTTLIKVISTILRPDNGRVLIDGHDTVRDAAHARALLSVVAASGWLSFDQQLTLTQNLAFWGRLCGLRPGEAMHRALAALNVVGLGEWRDETPNHLSSGMRQRLAIAKGLLVRAPVFVLDEPTANVDPIVAWQIRDFLRNDLNRTLGQTIMLATHNMAEAEQLCDRVAIINRGNLLVCDRPAALTAALGELVVTVTAHSEASRVLGVLRESSVARHIADNIDHDDTGSFRLLLRPGFSRQDVTSLLNCRVLNTTTIAPATPTLEDVFMHHAGRSLNVDGDA
jgi:ABC-2 type transport system ATP-binding protein